MSSTSPNSRAAHPGAPRAFAWLLAALALGAFGAPSSATEAPPAVRPVVGDSLGEGALRLARAQAAWRMGQPLEVIRVLEAVDFASPPAFEGADRAAFLLAQAWLRLGAHARFDSLARQVAGWPRSSEFTRALADQRALLDPAADARGALRAGGAPRLREDAEGAVHFRAAAESVAAGGDARDELGRVPGGSAHDPAARDLAARLAYERGDSSAAVRALANLLERDPGYANRRELEALLADDALRRGDAHEAYRLWGTLDAEWTATRDSLRTLATRKDLEPLIAAWEDDPAASGAPLVPARRSREGAAALGRSRADRGEGAGDPGAAFDRPERVVTNARVFPPSAPEWAALSNAQARTGEADAAAARAGDEARRERESAAELQRYLRTGQDSLAREHARIETRLARLGELHRALDAIDARLRAVRDSATRRVLRRAAALLAACEANQRWIAGLDHFWVKGPAPMHAPAGYASPESVLVVERALVRGVADIAARVAAESPGTIARSYERAWRPGVLDRIARQDAEAAASLAWAKRLAGSLDSSLAVATRAELSRALAARAERLAGHADSLRAAAGRERDAVARSAVRRTLATMEDEREAIDYGLAASAWAIAAGLDHATDAGAADSGAAAQSPEASRWRDEAISRLQAFLAGHPGAAGRADARYRLADLLEQRARVAFRARMEQYLKSPTGTVPVLETGPSIALHRASLQDDPKFQHRDAVLYDLGTLLAERGDAAAITCFRTLVNDHPDSPLAQESWLHLADEAFDQQRFYDAVPLYRAAVEGADTTLRTIALYKLGWTEFHVDHFEQAADAFGDVLDLYAAGRVDARIRLDDDAEVLLVHSLARGGGAEAFTAHFERVGPRPYEMRLLRALGQHFRKYALFGPAIAADQLMLDRYPLAPDALESARRMDETYRRWNHPEERRAALLANAERFSPGSAWITARAGDSLTTRGDSLRAAGDAFARAALLEVAWEHHAAGRERGDAGDWREAARLEERVLATWPAEPNHRALMLQASESRAALGDVAGALAHVDSVADGRDTLAAAARLQRIAVLDAWYERTRAASAGPVGSDSVARAVLAAGESLLDGFPADAHAADVRWRQGQISFAHGWFDRAAEAFGAFAGRHPGDPRAPRAATLRADAFVRLERFDRAQEAYESAFALARSAGDDSLARRVERAIPACAYRYAESRVAADSTDYSSHAARFENVALRWPTFEHADAAFYRAGLAYFRAGRTADGARAMGSLAARRPGSSLARDAGRATASAWEAAGDTAAAAQAWLDFAARFRSDPQSDDASLRAAGFFERAGRTARADSLRLAWIRRHPADEATALALLEPVASRSLDSVSTARPISRWLPAAKKRTSPRTSLADYLARAAKHPELASRSLLARVRFLEGEEAAAACARVALRQPLAKTIGSRKSKLDVLLARYRACIALGDPEWSHAASFRIGEALVAFGDALEASERPADLKGEDRAAYDEVIHRQSDVFYQRAEGVWHDLLEGTTADSDDAWLARARAALQPRLALRAQVAPSTPPPANPPAERNQQP